MRRAAASAELARQVEKSTPAAHEPILRSTFSLSLLGVLCMAPSHVEPIASCPFQCLSPLFCTALRRLSSRAVEAAVSASLPFLAFHFAFNSLGPGSRPCSRSSNGPSGTFTDGYVIVGLYFFKSVFVGSFQPSVYTSVPSRTRC